MSIRRRPAFGLHQPITAIPAAAVVAALVEAARHARVVAAREHIKADRFDRVRLFVVSLRRSLMALSNLDLRTRQYLVGRLARAAVWHDVGVLNPAAVSGLAESDSMTVLQQRHVAGWLELAGAADLWAAPAEMTAAADAGLVGLRQSLVAAEAARAAADGLATIADGLILQLSAAAADVCACYYPGE